MVLMALIIALLFYRFRSVAMRHITRRHQGIAIDVSLPTIFKIVEQHMYRVERQLQQDPAESDATQENG